jgi:hypothetical protein
MNEIARRARELRSSMTDAEHRLLALLYLREGRIAAVKRLSEEIYPILEAQDIHRETAAALMLFQEAARQEQLTVKVVREYVKYLREARTDRALRFRQIAVS